MKFWNQYPLLRILIPLLAGILIYWYFPDTPITIPLAASVIVLLMAWIFKPKGLNKYGFDFIGGILMAISFFFLGFFLTQSSQQQLNELHYSHQDKITHFLVRIDEPLTPTQNAYKTIGKVLAVQTDSTHQMQSSYGKLLLYFKKTDTLLLNYGDEVVIGANFLSPIKNMGNPYEFDYKSYLARYQIFDQMYLTETDWLKTEKSSGNILLSWSYQIRDQLIWILESFDFPEEAFAVASAILVGYDEYLDQDLRQLYAGSGAMHILCVSGLHVGIIFLILNILLKPFDLHRKTKIIKTIIIIILIWFYALITGMSPSVFRAATMFSFVSFGQVINRRTSVYNSLAASAVVLMITDPLVIFHIGFQLSYSAILGILFIQPLIASIFTVKNIIIKYFWELLAVSIAAQIGTFPLGIFYFHQFPNYFFITNMFVIPMSFLILIDGFITLIIESISLGSIIVFSWFKEILEFLLFLLNSGVDLINQLPFSVSRNLYFTFWDTIVVYAGIIFITSTFVLKKIKWAYLAIFIFGLLMILNTSFRTHSFSRKSENLIFYNIPKSGLLEFSSGNESFVLIDSSLYASMNYQRYLSESNLNNRIKKQHFILLDTINKDHPVLYIGDRKLFIINELSMVPKVKMDIDLLWIRNSPDIYPFKALENIQPQQIIMDATNNYRSINKWTAACDSLKIPIHNTKKEGAFVLKTP